MPALGLLLLLAAPALAGEPLSGAESSLPRSVSAAGGERSVSSSYKLSSTVGELASSTAASAGTVLRPGARQTFHFPGAVTNLTGIEGVCLTSTTLQWTAPGYDGRFGSLQAWTTYYVRVASFTVPDTYRYSYALDIAVSTKDTAPGLSVSTPVYGLISNTTYFSQLWTKDAGGNMSYRSNRSTFTTLSTAVSPVHAGADPFYLSESPNISGVYFTSASVRWAALPRQPPFVDSMTARGYVVQASSTNFGVLSPGGVVSSSFSYHVLASTLVVCDPPLMTNKLYYFRVGSLNHDGTPHYAFFGTTQTRLQPVDPLPADPAFTDISSYSLTVNVDPNGNADYTLFVIEASTVQGYAAEAFTSSSTYNFHLSSGGLTSNTTYWFRVYASTGGSNSAYVELGSTSTLTAPPASVTPAFHDLSSDGFSASWSADGNPLQVTTYSAVITTGTTYPNSNDYNVALTTKPEGSPPTATYVSIEPNTTYYLFAAGVNHNSVPSEFKLVGTTCTHANPPAELPQTYYEMSPAGFSVLWDAVDNPLAATTYTVHVSTKQDFTPAENEVAFTTVPAAGPMASFTGLSGNTTYYLRIRAVNHASVWTDYTVFAETSTLAESPSDLHFKTVYPTEDAIRLDWSLGGNRPQSTYTVTASTDPDFGFGAAMTTDSVLAVYLSSTALSADTTYYYRVRAWNNNGLPSDYAYASTATLAALPLAASPVYPALFLTSATVRWGRGTNPVDRTTYTVELSASPSFDPFELDHVDFDTAPAGALPAASFTGLTPNTTYHLRVRAVNHDGVPSDWLVPGETSTLAGLPTGAEVSAVFNSSLTLTWDYGSAAGYALQGSSTNFAAAGKVYLSSTTNGAAYSLTLSGHSDETLWPNTTFFLRVSALNHDEVASSVLVSSRSTLPDAVSGLSFRTGGLDGVNSTSATVTWVPLPSAAAAGSSRACEGYTLEAATADAWGYSDFGGDILSSTTFVYAVGSQLRPSTLTVVDLNPGTTYAFRVGALNHSGAAEYAHAGSSMTRITPFTWLGGTDNYWYTAANWSPNGVPGQGSPVTIALNNAQVMVRNTDPPISFSSVTLGKADASVSVNLDLATSTFKAGDILVYKNAGLTLATTQLLLLTGDFTLLSGSSLSHRANTTAQSYSINATVGGTFDLQAGATVYALGRGYAGGAANGGDGYGTGQGFGDVNSNGGGSGAGHGGGGGSASSNVGGSAYDSKTSPAYAGSGGGGGDTSAAGVGGAGGGYVRIQAATLILNGLISADGTAGGAGDAANANAGAGGGGSGGGVNLHVDYFVGQGTISALGGTGGTDTDAGNDPGGGGGGGRVSIDVALGGNTCDVFVSTAGGAAGGGTSNAGSGGTYSSTVTLPVPGFYSAYATTVSIRWTWAEAAGSKYYQVFSSSGGAGQSPLLANGTTAYTEWELLPNTTYTRYVQVSACGNTGNSSSDELATHAKAPLALSQSFPGVSLTSITVAWAARPSSPDSESSRGYLVEASSTDFSGEGTIYSSQTLNVLLSTLTLRGLDPNTTYYFRAASLNWAGAWSTYTHFGSTSTLSYPPLPLAESFLEVFETSATVNWVALPTAAADAASKSASGYVLEASSTDFGAFLPGGAVYSSATPNVVLSTLTVGWSEALDYCTTYYFRVASLNQAGAADYRVLGTTPTLIDHGAAFITKTLALGNVEIDMDYLVPTGLIVKNAGTCPTSYALKAATITAGSPWVVSTSSDTDEFTLQAGFNPSQPSSDDFGEEDKLADSPLECTATRFALGQNGLGFAAKEERTLWFKIGMPTITSTDLPQDIQVTLISLPASP